MYRIISLILVFGLLVTQAACAQAGGPSGYDAPQSTEDIEAWTNIRPHTWSPDPGNPRAPVGFYFMTGPDYGVHSYAEAFAFIESHTREVELVGEPTMRRIDSYKLWYGTDAYIVLHETRKGVMVAYFNSLPESYQDIIITGYDITREDFEAWGGALNMLNIRGAEAYYNAVPEEVRSRLARAPFRNQTESYNFIMDQVMSNGIGNLTRLQELHYDTLFGDDITSPFIAD